MKKLLLSITCIIFLLAGVAINSATAIPVVLDYVPSYYWYHGCTPTAAASIIGYWDLHGYDNLFDASGWDEVRLTKNVKDQISSPEHNAKYDPKPDDPNLPDPPDTSIADFLHASEDVFTGVFAGYGATYHTFIPSGVTNYMNYWGYDFISDVMTSPFTEDDFTHEIDSGYPMLFSVDTDSNGSGNHSIPVFGYDIREDGLWFAAYTTWHEDETIDWFKFVTASVGYSGWGIAVPRYIRPFSDIPSNHPNPVPEPSTMILFGTGLIGLVGWKTERFKRR